MNHFCVRYRGILLINNEKNIIGAIEIAKYYCCMIEDEIYIINEAQGSIIFHDRELSLKIITKKLTWLRELSIRQKYLNW